MSSPPRRRSASWRPRELWEGADLPALTAEIVESAVDLANGAIAAVSELEKREVGALRAAELLDPDV